MTDVRHFVLAHDTARKLAAAQCHIAPDGYHVLIKPPTRNLDQNAKLWAMLHDISEQVNWHGNKLTDDEWKDVFSSALKRQRVVPGIDGGFVVCGQRTSTMSKREFSEMIELITAFAAEHGVVFREEA